MRIRSFSEARGIFESEEFSLEPHIYCFGGGGGGGDGGSSGGSTHPGRPGGESGERGNRTDRGDGNDRDDRGGGSDRDSRNPGNIGVGSGASLGATSNANFSAGNIGFGGGGSDRNFNVSPVGAPSYPQAPDFSARQAPIAGIPSLSAETISRDQQAIEAAQARNALSGVTDITSGLQTGTVARDTVMSPSASDIFGEGTMTDEERAASNAELAAIDARAAAAQNALAAGTPAAAQVQEARSSALGPVADIEVAYSPSNVLSPDTARAVDQSIDRAISDFAGYRIGRTQEMDDQGNVTTDDFALSRDLVSQPPAFGGGYNPAEQLRMQEGAEALPAISVPDIDVFGAKIPASIVGRVASDILSPASAVERALREGATPVSDQQGRIVGAVDENGTVYSISPFSDIMSGIKGELAPGMEEAYAQQRAIQDAERERNGDNDGGGQPIIPPVEDFIGEAQIPERNQFELGEYNYEPRGPISYSYTGLPSLAPTRLQPSFRARGSYSPLFPIG